MRILITNDDGIHAPGILHLAQAAAQLGEVWVIAPKDQCSAMSHGITLRRKLHAVPFDFPVNGVHAYSLDGTPADCIKVAICNLMPERPDYVFSGINFGYNTAFAIAYSATVASCMEARMNNIPAIAFSNRFEGSYEIPDRDLPELMRQLTSMPLSDGEIWNVNFPGCPASEHQGVLWDRKPARTQLFQDYYTETVLEDGSIELDVVGNKVTDASEDSDLWAVFHGYTSIGKIRSMVL